MLDGFKNMIINTSLYKNFEEQSTKIFNRPQSQTSYKGLTDEILQKIQISVTEFDDYKSKIMLELREYTKNKFTK